MTNESPVSLTNWIHAMLGFLNAAAMASSAAGLGSRRTDSPAPACALVRRRLTR